MVSNNKLRQKKFYCRGKSFFVRSGLGRIELSAA
jgi:hypothetical protein